MPATGFNATSRTGTGRAGRTARPVRSAGLGDDQSGLLPLPDGYLQELFPTKKLHRGARRVVHAAMKPPVAKATTARRVGARFPASPPIPRSRARSSPKWFAAIACRPITAPNARRVLGPRARGSQDQHERHGYANSAGRVESLEASRSTIREASSRYRCNDADHANCDDEESKQQGGNSHVFRFG
jgi:hypothetical protein